MDSLDIRDYLIILIRRRNAALAVAAAVMLVTIAGAYLWPPKYQSVGTIQIQQPDIPPEVVASSDPNVGKAVEAFADQRIEQIHQKITATANLIDVITKLDLYKSLRDTMPIAGVVQRMQKDIKLELLSADLANPSAANRLEPGQLAAIAFTIGFNYGDPGTAQRVDNELITRFLDEDLRIRREQAKNTSSFLAEQTTILEKSLEEQEKKMSDFLSQHSGERSEDLSFNMQMAAQTGASLDSISQQLANLGQQRAAAEQSLASMQPFAVSVNSGEGQMLVSAGSQLKALRTRLAALSGQYGPEHPDIVALQRQIAALESKGGAGNDSGPAPNGGAGKSAEADNPAYLMLQSQIKSLDGQYQVLLAQQAETRRQHELYQKRVSETPTVNRDYASLSRDYENAQLRYRELKEKKMSADMSEKLEQGRKGERLVVIDSPDLPTSPRIPPRRIVFALGLILALSAGVGSAVALELLSGAVRGPTQLADLTGAPPLVSVPLILNAADRERGRVRNRQMAGGAVILALVFLIVFGQWIMPFDVLWSVVGQRLGGS